VITILDRYRVPALAIGAVVAMAAAAMAYAQTGSPAATGRALVAGAIAVAVVGLALTLPGSTLRGAAIGGFFVTAGVFTWTFTNRPTVVWAVLLVEGVVFAVWGRPWLVHLRALPRLGGVWLGLAYWLLGIVGAVLVVHLTVAVQRVAYAGVFALAALAVVATVRRPDRRGGDPSVGIAAAILVGIAVLLLAGSGNVFDALHSAPDNPSAQLMRYRFWGGLGLFYHPNSMAGLAVVAALRIGPDRAFAAWQRLAVTGLAGFVLFLTNSRIGFVFAVCAALLHAVLVVRGRHADLPAGRRVWLAVGTPFAVLALVLALSGGQGFLFQNRFGGASGSAAGTDVTSGRTATWKQVAGDWRHAGWAEKVFGDARTSRAVVIRTNDGMPAGAERAKLNTDNAAVGALRRGGVLGVLAFLVGLGLLLWHAVRRRADGTLPAAWFTIAAVAAVPTIASEDWLLGGTNGAVWLLLLAGEVITRGARIGVEQALGVPVEADHRDQTGRRSGGQSPGRTGQPRQPRAHQQSGEAGGGEDEVLDEEQSGAVHAADSRRER
jgi:hypothetical protein